MNKKILTAAIGAAMVAGPLAAQADYKISGRVAGELLSNDGTIEFKDFGNSRLQFDMKDGGFFARAAMDIRGLAKGTATSAIIGRDVYVGGGGSWGNLRAGRVAGAVKNLEGDPFIATFLEYRNGLIKGGSYGSSSFVNNMIQYDVKFGGNKLILQYDITDNGGKNGDTGISFKGKAGGFGYWAGWNNEANATGEGYWKVGGDWGMDIWKINLAYESDTTASVDTTAFIVGVGIKAGGGLIDFSYGDNGGDGTNAGYRLGWIKKETKKTRWWVGYSQNGSKAATDVASWGGGLRVDL